MYISLALVSLASIALSSTIPTLQSRGDSCFHSGDSLTATEWSTWNGALTTICSSEQLPLNYATNQAHQCCVDLAADAASRRGARNMVVQVTRNSNNGIDSAIDVNHDYWLSKQSCAAKFQDIFKCTGFGPGGSASDMFMGGTAYSGPFKFV